MQHKYFKKYIQVLIHTFAIRDGTTFGKSRV
jgi:hypothetical protein